MSCGGDNENAAAYIRKLCARKNLDFMGLETVVMPDNYVALYSVTPKESEAPIIRRATDQILAAAEAMRRGELLTRLGTVGKTEVNKVYEILLPKLIQNQAA